MRLKTIFIIVITILLTIVIMQNTESVSFKILFFQTQTSKLLMMTIVAIVGFIIGFMIGRPKNTALSKDYDHGYDPDGSPTGYTNKAPDTLSDEDRDYISD